MLIYLSKPKEIKDIKKFLTIAIGSDKEGKDQKESEQKKNVPPAHKKSKDIELLFFRFIKALYIKHGKQITKFKLRGKRYLYTFQTADKEKAGKLLQTLPPSKTNIIHLLFNFFNFILYRPSKQTSAK